VRNVAMAKRIEAAPVEDPVRFAFAGDSGAWPDPTADAIFAQIVQQVAEVDPLFFANLGDFAGPGTFERHQAYLRLVEPLPIPNICVVGNHDLDDASGREAWERVHGSMNFDFGHGHTRFVAIHAASRPGRHDERASPEAVEGPQREDLEFLESALSAAAEPNRIVLMHMPPYLDGRYAPHENWGFGRYEREFLDIVRAHRVTLVCCAHGLAFDEHVDHGVRYVMSGGGGSGLCSHLRGVCVEGKGTPEDRGSLFHFVEVSVGADGTIAGRVVQAFADPATARYEFGTASSA
jgi:calcineurin-like phosphoesterase family protein